MIPMHTNALYLLMIPSANAQEQGRSKRGGRGGPDPPDFSFGQNWGGRTPPKSERYEKVPYILR